MTRVARAFFAAAAIAVTLAAGASATQSTIYPGVGIGQVKLGMTLAQGRGKFGPATLLSVRARLPSGKRYIEYLWNYSEYRLGFVGGARPTVVIVPPAPTATSFVSVFAPAAGTGISAAATAVARLALRELRPRWTCGPLEFRGVRARRARPDRVVTYPQARLRCPV